MRTLFTGITGSHPDDIRRRYGEDVVCTPLIDIAEVDDDTALRQALADISRYDYVLFTSRFAVAPFTKHVPWPQEQKPRIVSIGRTTTETLRNAGCNRVEQVEQDNSYGVVQWFGQQPAGHVLIPRSDIALPLIPDGLRQQGFDVTTVTAYVNRMPEHPEKVDLDTIGHIVFTSPSTVDRFVSLYGTLPADKRITARGPVTEARVRAVMASQAEKQNTDKNHPNCK